MILHSPIISGSLTFADGSTFTLPDNGIYSGSYSGSFQGTTYTGGTFVGDGSQLTFGGTGIVSGSSQLTTDLDARYLNTTGEGVVSGSSQITISGTTGYSSFSSSLDSRISTEKGRVDAILASADANADTFAEIVTLINSVDTTNDNAFASFYTASNAANDAQSARLTSIESVTGSYETKGRGIVSGSSQVVYASLSSIPAGIVSGSSQINLGSVSGNTTSNVTEGTNLYYSDARVKTKLTAEGVISGSSQVTYANISAIPSGIISGSTQLNNTTIDSAKLTNAELSGSFSGSVQLSKLNSSIIPSATNTYDLGSPTAQFRHVYISSGSLYVNGIQTISTTGTDLVIKTDSGQSLKLLEDGTDDITLQTADGNIQLKSSGGGDVILDPTTGLISVRGTLQVQDGNKITSSNRTNVVFGDDVVISGSLTTTSGIINGVNITTLNNAVSSDKARIDAILASADANADTFAEIVTLINSVDTTNDTAFAAFYTASNATNTAQSARLTAIESVTGSYETKGNGIVSGSSQITYGGLSAIPAGIVSGSSQITPLLPTGVISGSSQVTYASISSIPAGIVSGSAQVTPLLPTGVVSGSSQINLGSVNGNSTSNVTEGSNLYYTDARVKTKLDAEGVVSGSSQITYATISSIPAGIVSGSSQVTSLLPGGVISGSSQLTTEFDARYLNTLGDGIVSSSAQVTSLLPSGVVSGSTQVLGGTGIVSGSSQINLASVTGNTTTNVSEGTNLYYTDARVKTKLTAEGVISGSVQVLGGTGIVSGSSQVTPLLPSGVVSGSSQVTYASISSIPAGIVSGSAQVTPLLPSGVVSGSVQVLGGTGIVSGSSQVSIASTTGFGTYINQALLTTSDVTHNNVTVSGNLIVNGTTTTVNSTTVQLNDNIIELNGSGAANGGLIVKDATAPNTISGSLLWDSTNDYWKAGAVGSELPLVTTSGTQTLTNKTIDGSQLVNASVANAKLANSSVTVTAGTGMSGGGSVALGSTITLTNAGVTSAVAGTGVSVSGATGAVTFSIGQAVATTSAVTFASVSATGDVIAYASSDRRLKDNIKNIENPIEKVQQLNGVTWEWNSNADELQQSLPTVGVIAQEVEEVLPQLVHNRENGYKGVDYAKLTGLLIEAIKEQQKQIDELKSKLK